MLLEIWVFQIMSINWSIFASATSDSASTQAKFNKLIEMHKEEDEMKFGQSTGGTVGFINCLNLIKIVQKENTIKPIISFMNLPSYSGNMVYQNIVWESYS